MRYVDVNLDPIADVDLTKGFIIPVRVVKIDAPPIDNKKKFAWADDDYENAMMYVVFEEAIPEPPSLEDRMDNLEAFLRKIFPDKFKLPNFKEVGK